jgi:alkylhydroperoxidase family enzyme
VNHAEYLREDGGADLETAVAVSTDWRQAKLEPAECAMLEFGEKLTVLPSAMTEQDVDALRSSGFTDREILSITLSAAYRNFITRIADSLGAELSSLKSYDPDILRAFGADMRGAEVTLYGDRTAGSEPPVAGVRRAALVRGADAGGDVCWIEASKASEGSMAALSAEVEQLTGPHPLRHLARAFSLRPDALQATLGIGRQVGMGGAGLGRRMEAVVGVVVAATLGVPYMGVHHAQLFLDSGGTPEELEELVEEPSGGGLSGQEGEVARYCEKVTRVPGDMAKGDVERLRAVGMEDAAILTVAAGAALESFLNGVAAGLGVRLEDTAFSRPALEVFGVAD